MAAPDAFVDLNYVLTVNAGATVGEQDEIAETILAALDGDVEIPGWETGYVVSGDYRRGEIELAFTVGLGEDQRVMRIAMVVLGAVLPSMCAQRGRSAGGLALRLAIA